MTIMQGDSYPIYIDLEQDGLPLTPDMVAEMEVTVGDNLSKLYSKGGVLFDEETDRWYIHPSQKETLTLPADQMHDVIVRIRYKGSIPEEVVGLKVGKITVRDGVSEAVI